MFSVTLLIAASTGCKNMSQEEKTQVKLCQRVQNILQKAAPADWQPSNINRTAYLDIIERIVRTAEPWVDDNGAVIDPVLKYEHGQTSPRFASTCAVVPSTSRERKATQK